MVIYKANHKVYELKYHFVLIIKYRKNLLEDEVEKYLKNVFEGICYKYDFVLETIGFDVNHVHLMIQTLPNSSPSRVFQVLKSVSARQVFRRYPKMKRYLWGGNFWFAGGHVGTVGEGKNAAIIRNYIKNQGKTRRNLRLTDFS